jgi:hypothetical protein
MSVIEMFQQASCDVGASRSMKIGVLTYSLSFPRGRRLRPDILNTRQIAVA